MNKSYIIVFSLLLMIIGGCKSKNAEQPTENQNQQQTQNTQQKPQNFDNATQPGTTPVASALIPATNPDQRAKSVIKGSDEPNRNPFAVITPPPLQNLNTGGGIPDITPGPNINGSNVNIINTTSINNDTKITGGSPKTTTGNGTTSRGGRNGQIPPPPTKFKEIPKPEKPVQISFGNTPPPQRPTLSGSIPVPPPPTPVTVGNIPDFSNPKSPRNPAKPPRIDPEFSVKMPPSIEPKLAQQIKVSGVININGENHAIVTGPGESQSRYVKTGDLLANGNVLVKAINPNNGTILLEELGMEQPVSIDTAEKSEQKVQ